MDKYADKKKTNTEDTRLDEIPPEPVVDMNKGVDVDKELDRLLKVKVHKKTVYKNITVDETKSQLV